MKKQKDLQRFVCLDDHDGRRGNSNKDVEICNKMHCFHFFQGNVCIYWMYHKIISLQTLFKVLLQHSSKNTHLSIYRSVKEAENWQEGHLCNQIKPPTWEKAWGPLIVKTVFWVRPRVNNRPYVFCVQS